MRIEANTYDIHEHIYPTCSGVPIQTITHKRIENYTATHGRVTATAPTMYEAIALCTNGVYQAKFIKSND